MELNVSVIIPIYNVEKYISQCLESVLKQTIKNIEIICINDGSTDSSLEIVENYQKEDKRIIIINKANEGYGAACNAGLRISRGEYISIIESDDFIDKQMLENLYNLAIKNDADIVKSSFYEYRDNNEERISTRKKIDWSSQYNMPDSVFEITDCTQLVYFHPSIWSCIYKKTFLDKNNIRFVEAKGAGWVDNPFQIQTLCSAKRIFYTDDAYYYYRLNNPTSSSNIVNILNPFERSDEIHSYLEDNNINDKNFLAHLYKREMSYIHIVLSGINSELLDFAFQKIKDMIYRMDEQVIYENEFITDYEKWVYESCQNDDGIIILMKKIQSENKNRPIISIG